jgi:hypothetical protein
MPLSFKPFKQKDLWICTIPVSPQSPHTIVLKFNGELTIGENFTLGKGERISLEYAPDCKNWVSLENGIAVPSYHVKSSP